MFLRAMRNGRCLLPAGLVVHSLTTSWTAGFRPDMRPLDRLDAMQRDLRGEGPTQQEPEVHGREGRNNHQLQFRGLLRCVPDYNDDYNNNNNNYHTTNHNNHAIARSALLLYIRNTIVNFDSLKNLLGQRGRNSCYLKNKMAMLACE